MHRRNVYNEKKSETNRAFTRTRSVYRQHIFQGKSPEDVGEKNLGNSAPIQQSIRYFTSDQHLKNTAGDGDIRLERPRLIFRNGRRDLINLKTIIVLYFRNELFYRLTRTKAW